MIVDLIIDLILDFFSALIWSVVFVYAPFDFYIFFIQKQALQKEKARSIVIVYLLLIAFFYLVAYVPITSFNIFVPIMAVYFGRSVYENLISE